MSASVKRSRLSAFAAATCLAGCVADPASEVPVVTVADIRQWPSESDLTGLQPHPTRYFSLGYGTSDVPAFLAPEAHDVICQTTRRSPLQLKCRYTLVATDWVGHNPPTRQVQDLLERDASGSWKIVAFDVE